MNFAKNAGINWKMVAAVYVMIVWNNGQMITRFIYKKGERIMFSTGLILSAGATVGIALLEKYADQAGIHWLGTVTRIVIPLTGMVLAVYFLNHNALLKWIR